MCSQLHFAKSSLSDGLSYYVIPYRLILLRWLVLWLLTFKDLFYLIIVSLSQKIFLTLIYEPHFTGRLSNLGYSCS